MNSLKNNPIVILDFGSQYTQLIGRRIREIGVYCEIHPCIISDDALKRLNPCGIILSGGPASTTSNDSPKISCAILASGIPILGICYGMQTIASSAGGEVVAAASREFGHAEISVDWKNPLFS